MTFRGAFLECFASTYRFVTLLRTTEGVARLADGSEVLLRVVLTVVDVIDLGSAVDADVLISKLTLSTIASEDSGADTRPVGWQRGLTLACPGHESPNEKTRQI